MEFSFIFTYHRKKNIKSYGFIVLGDHSITGGGGLSLLGPYHHREGGLAVTGLGFMVLALGFNVLVYKSNDFVRLMVLLFWVTIPSPEGKACRDWDHTITGKGACNYWTWV